MNQLRWTLLFMALTCIQLNAQLPILHLAEEADAVLIGESAAPSKDENVLTFDIRSSFVLKGDIDLAFPVVAVLPELDEGAGAFSGLVLPTRAPRAGAYGLWFLRRLQDGRYSGIANQEGEGLTNFVKTLFIEMPRSWTPETGVEKERLLLEAALESYRYSLDGAFPQQGSPDEARRRLIGSLQHAGRYESSRGAALDLLDKLLASPSVEQSDIGLVAGIRMSYDSALAHLAANLDSIRSRPDTIGAVLFELETAYDPSSPEGLARIHNLILLNQIIRVPGLDNSLAKSLRNIKNSAHTGVGRESLPLAALLLDSSDPEAVRRASHQFYVYAMVSNDDGYGGKSFLHEGIRSHDGLSESRSAQENAAFWREWWEDTKTAADQKAGVGVPPGWVDRQDSGNDTGKGESSFRPVAEKLRRAAEGVK